MAALAVMFVSLFFLSHSPLVAANAREERLSSGPRPGGARGRELPST
jgi:hypothetical protein